MEKIQEVLAGIIEKLFGVEIEPAVTVAPENTGADYATNVAMQLAKLVHKAPMVIAEMIKGEFTEAGVELTIAAPGFLNFTIDSTEVVERAREYAHNLPAAVKNETYRDKMAIVEFSDPNPFKVLHVGHLYTSIVGDSISRLLEHSGAKVVRANFGGDVGLHVAKTLYALIQQITIADNGHSSSSADALLTHRTLSTARSATPASSNNNHSEQSDELEDSISSQITKPGDTDNNHSKQSSESGLMQGLQAVADSEEVAQTEAFKKFLVELKIEDIAKCYVEGTRAYEEDEAAKAQIAAFNKQIYQINEQDFHGTVLADLYWRGRELSYQYFEDFYARIGVKFDKYYPESMVAGRGLKEVKAHIGTTYEESDGAIVYKGEKVGLHTRVFINREGVPTYEAKDVGLIFTKWDDWHFDESVIVTGSEQAEYMKVVLASVSEYAPQLVERTRHLTHGLVKLQGNVKMSSRKGNFLKAVDVLEMVGEQLKKSENTGAEIDDMIMLAAIKYAFLKYKMGGDIVFDPQESVSMTGNSGIYLLYSAVRAKKILQKRGGEKFESKPEEVEREKTFEKNLCKKIVQYRDALNEAIIEKAPHKVCSYLYELSQEFSRFYEHARVSGNAREDELMEVVEAYKNIMEHGLGILGISIPESM